MPREAAGTGVRQSRPVARTAHPKTKVPRATYLASPTALPMAPKPAYDLNKHMRQRAGPAGRVDGRPARLCGRSRPSCRHSRMEAVGGATRHGLPCRAAPPASSPRGVLVEKASQAGFHVKIDSIEHAELHPWHLRQHGQARDLGVSRAHAQHARAHLSRIAGAAVTPGTSNETICSFAAQTAASWRISLAGAVVCAERRQQPIFSASSA